jgi:hypothetical protein
MPLQMHLITRRFVTVLFILFLTFLFTPPVSSAADTEGANHDNSLPENELPDFDENGFDEILDGFDDESEDIPTTDKPEDPDRFGIEGDFSLHSACSPWNDDERWDGLTRLRTELFLELNGTFSDSWKLRISGKGFYDFAYRINGRDDYTREVLDEYEKDVELFEAYIMGSLSSSLDIKAGRQIVVWGKSDYIRVTDVLNPLDLQIPGLTDIEYLRLPVTMTRMDFYFGNWNLSGIAVHEHRYNKSPVFGSDFYFLPGPEPPEDIPAVNLKNTELAAAINGTFSGWDISLYFADIYDDTPYIDWVSGRMKHAPITMTGISSNVAIGNWLYIGEAAYFSGLNFSLPSGKTFSRTDILGGIQYSGINDMTLNIEAVNRHVHDYDEALELAPILIKRNLFQSVLRISRTFMNETLTLTILASTYGTRGRDGAFQRLTAEYDITDAIEITFSAILYTSGNLTQFQDIGDNDRLYLEIKYSF